MQGLQIGNCSSSDHISTSNDWVLRSRSRPCTIWKVSGCCEDGTETPFSNWLEIFNFIVEPFHLSDKEKAVVLVSNLTGPAREEILYCLSNEERRSFKEVVEALRLCFSREDSHYLRCLFHNRVQRDDEDLADFSRALMRLYTTLVDVADDETGAAALGQLRDEALSSQFVSGALDVRERFMLRRLYLKNRGGRFEVLRREALVILRDGCMLEGDGLKAGNTDTAWNTCRVHWASCSATRSLLRYYHHGGEGDNIHSFGRGIAGCRLFWDVWGWCTGCRYWCWGTRACKYAASKHWCNTKGAVNSKRGECYS